MSLADFRETFDRKTRNEWDLFGLKGLSGAMFLNKFAKYLPDQENAASVLKTALRAPTTESEARTQLHELMAYLDRQISAGVATGAGFQPNRSPFFVSACWHAQQPGQWPIMFQSAREALQADGLLGRNLSANRRLSAVMSLSLPNSGRGRFRSSSIQGFIGCSTLA